MSQDLPVRPDPEATPKDWYDLDPETDQDQTVRLELDVPEGKAVEITLEINDLE